ncbi:MAG: PorV/PorQ family protein [Bacteroidota bacterium]
MKTGLPFLKTGSDARSTAMGEASVAVTDDHSTFFYNPASIRFSDRRQVAVSHRQGFAETSNDYLGATLPGGTLTFGFSAYTTSINNIEVRLRPGDAEGTFSARNGAIGLGAALSLTDDLAFGLSGKLLYEKIYIDEASGYGFDAGLLYKVNNEINAGLSIVNVGSMSVLRSEKSVLPTTVRLGASYKSALAESFGFIGAADIVKTVDDSNTHLHAGAEIVYNSMLMLRAGYQTGYETRSFSAGAGVQYGIIRVDYAFAPMTGAFDPNHTFSLTFQL